MRVASGTVKKERKAQKKWQGFKALDMEFQLRIEVQEISNSAICL